MDFISSLPILSRLAYMESHGNTIFNMNSPEDLLNILDDIRSPNEAMMAAQLFYRFYCDVAICLIPSNREQAIMTIVDWLEFDNNVSIGDWLLANAFKAIGMKRAKECPLDQLHFLYCMKMGIPSTNLPAYFAKPMEVETGLYDGEEIDNHILIEFLETKTLTEDNIDVLLAFKNVDERIAMFEIATGNLEMQDQPDAIISWFLDIQNYDQAMRLAMVFGSKFGDEVICREASACQGRLITVMDFINEFMEEWDDTVAHWLIAQAFRNLGFKRSEDCNHYSLFHSYCFDANYRNLESFIKYDYESMKESRKWINHDLQKYLFHPRFIQKWLDQGETIDTYLNL